MHEDGDVKPVAVPSIAAGLRLRASELREIIENASADVVTGEATLLAPIDGRTEVWASGVTYQSSRQARMEESASADVYARVYRAERPELFFKSVGWRVVTDGEPIGLRHDSALNVPEPELALVVNAWGEIVGYTVCNDVSSRTLEGENPLYLPQAKVYAGACALAPGIRPSWDVQVEDGLTISCDVRRDGAIVWSAETSTSQMRRKPEELVDWLFRQDHYPHGVILSTGTGLVPSMDFTLRDADIVKVRIESVGELTNVVAVGKQPFTWLSDNAQSMDS